MTKKLLTLENIRSGAVPSDAVAVGFLLGEVDILRGNLSLAEEGLANAMQEIERLRSDFKNFHRLLCERFGYGHDEVDWKRDQLSLIEWIAKRHAAEPTVHIPSLWASRRD
jgi:hypothetical protein